MRQGTPWLRLVLSKASCNLRTLRHCLALSYEAVQRFFAGLCPVGRATIGAVHIDIYLGIVTFVIGLLFRTFDVDGRYGHVSLPVSVGMAKLVAI